MTGLNNRKKVKKLFRTVFVILMILALPFAAAHAAQPLKIGVAYGLQGMWSDWCKKNIVAVEMAVAEINAAGGVNGMPLETVIYFGRPLGQYENGNRG